jgi:bla regulator protein BlaR1
MKRSLKCNESDTPLSAPRGWMILVLLICMGTAVSAQSPTAATTPSQAANASVGAPLAFEVISIRQKKEFSQGIPEVGPTPDGWRMVDNGLSFAVLHAYVPKTGAAFYTNEQVVGLPDWVRRESYEIHAKVSEADLADWQNPAKQPAMLQAMLQAMLVDRCKMVVHRTAKEVSVLALVPGKTGPKFKESLTGEPHASGVPLPGGGVIVPEDGGKTIHVYAAPMSSFASLLSGLTKQLVQDKTGLTGKYDFVIPNLAMLNATAQLQEGGGASDPGPTIFSVVGDLGLKLESTKGQVETLVIDHIERPTEN